MSWVDRELEAAWSKSEPETVGELVVELHRLIGLHVLLADEHADEVLRRLTEARDKLRTQESEQ